MAAALLVVYTAAINNRGLETRDWTRDGELKTATAE